MFLLEGKWHICTRVTQLVFFVLGILRVIAIHVRWVSCHHGMARPQVAHGGDALQFWRAAVNIVTC
jgi:hypothetical protein